MFNISLFSLLQLSNVQGVDQTSLAEILSHLPGNPPESIMTSTQQLLAKENVAVEEDTGNYHKTTLIACAVVDVDLQ